MPASAPPATITSASPRRMISLDLADGVAAGRAGRHRREVRAGHPELMAIWPAPMFGMPIGMRNGLIRSGPRRALVDEAVDERPDAAEAGAEDDPGPLGELALEPLGQPGLVERLACRDEPELDVAVGPAQLLAVEDAARVEVADLAGDPRRSAATGRTPRSSGRRTGRRRGPPRSSATSLPSAVTSAHAGHDDAAPLGHRTSFPVRTVAAR